MSGRISSKLRNATIRGYRLNRAALMRMEEGRRKVATLDDYYKKRGKVLYIKVDDSKSESIEYTSDYTDATSGEETDVYPTTTEPKTVAQMTKVLAKSSRRRVGESNSNDFERSTSKVINTRERKKDAVSGRSRSRTETSEKKGEKYKVRSETKPGHRKKSPNSLAAPCKTSRCVSSKYRPGKIKRKKISDIEMSRSRSQSSERTRRHRGGGSLREPSEVETPPRRRRRPSNNRETDEDKEYVRKSSKIPRQTLQESTQLSLTSQQLQSSSGFPLKGVPKSNTYGSNENTKKSRFRRLSSNFLRRNASRDKINSNVANFKAKKRESIVERKFEPINKYSGPHQNEVISKWKKMGIHSPSSTPSPDKSSLNQSSFRGDRVFRVQNVSNRSGKKNRVEKAQQELLAYDEELAYLLGLWNDKPYTERVKRSHEEEEVMLHRDVEEKMKQIVRLEKIAKEKLKQIEVIKKKKRKTLEEEAILSERLKIIFNKIQKIRESEAFNKILNKQTQVFATKKTKNQK